MILKRAILNSCIAIERRCKEPFHVLSCLYTRKNQRKSRLKSPTRWVPREWNCHAIQFATPAAWLLWYRLQSPPLRSTPDPLSGLAFMPLLASSAPFNLREKGLGKVVFHIQPRWPLKISPERGGFSPAIRAPNCFTPLLSGEGRGWGRFPRTTNNVFSPEGAKYLQLHGYSNMYSTARYDIPTSNTETLHCNRKA